MGNERLETEIKLVFEGTDLVTNVQVKGRLYDEENPLRLEYKIKDVSGKEKTIAKLVQQNRAVSRK